MVPRPLTLCFYHLGFVFNVQSIKTQIAFPRFHGLELMRRHESSPGVPVSDYATGQACRAYSQANIMVLTESASQSIRCQTTKHGNGYHVQCMIRLHSGYWKSIQWEKNMYERILLERPRSVAYVSSWSVFITLPVIIACVCGNCTVSCSVWN